MTTTPTSGAADLRDTLINIAREIEALKRECGMDPESPIAIQNGRYMALSYKVRALAAGRATAAQQGAAYAELPDQVAWRDSTYHCDLYYQPTYREGLAPLFTADQMRDFADRTHALRASHGQAPASKIEGLTAAQESLGVEFEKVLHDNLFDLYEESAPHWQAPAQPAPQQEAQEPAAVVVPCHTPSGKRVALYSDDCIKIVRGEWVRPDFSVDVARKQGGQHGAE